jgi:hypothetical protein
VLLTSFIVSLMLMVSSRLRSKGQIWYPTALEHCKSVAKEYGVSAQRVAAVLAVTSPSC